MILTLKLLKLRLEQEKKLNAENLALYKSITTYIKNSNLSVIEKEEVLQEIISLILEAQLENKPMNLFIGKDYEKFCMSIINEYNGNKSIYLKILNFIQKYLLTLIILSLFMAIVNKLVYKYSSFGITVDNFILANAISLILYPISRKIRQRNSSYTFYQSIFVNKENTYGEMVALVFYVIFIFLSRFIVGKIFGKEVFDYLLNLNNCIYYLILISFIVITIEFFNSTLVKIRNFK